MASGILTYINQLLGCEAESLQSLPESSAVRLRVLDTQSSFHSPPYASYSLPDRLSNYEWIKVVTTSYRPEKPWGSVLENGAINQNLEELTFSSNSFDILLTSDVLEHVRLYRKAHSEIARVLRPGGAYVFTVPHTRNSFDHIVRVATPDPGDASKDSYILAPEYHGSADPNEGPVLSYRVFGSSLDDELSEIGFSVTYTKEPNQRNAIYETELFYCILN
jgi:SAM-dependent methyltransferase